MSETLPSASGRRPARGGTPLLVAFALGGLIVAFLVARTSLREARQALAGEVAERTNAVTRLVEVDTRSLEQSLTFFAGWLETAPSFHPGAFHELHIRVTRGFPRLPWRAVAAAPLLPVRGEAYATRLVDAQGTMYDSLAYPPYAVTVASDPPAEPIWFAPVLLAEPFEARQGVFGFDMASSQARLSTIEQALAVDRPVLSPLVTLSQDEAGAPPSLLLIAPFALDVELDDPSGGVGADHGIAAMSFTPEALLARALADVSASDWRYRIEITERGSPLLAIGSGEAPGVDFTLPGPSRVGPAESRFALFGQEWSIALQPPPGQDRVGIGSATLGAIATLIVAGLLMTLVWRIGGERDRLESRLADQAVALRESQELIARSQRAEALGRLTGGVAHDFNNLLSVVSGNLELLADEIPADAADARAFLGDAIAASERGARLTQRLLTLGRRASLDPEVMEPDALVEELESLFRRTIPEDIGLEFSYDASGARVRADRAQVQTALLNLVVNARDAMPEGGRMTVRTSTLDVPGGRTTDAVPPGRWVVFEVEDQGHGMDAETLAKATDPFFTTKEAGQGTGLGLSTVVGFARQSNGDLLIDSTPGRGTRARLLLPEVDADPTDLPEPDRADADAPLDRRRVLLVEDEEAVRIVFERRLHRWGARTILSPNGDDAIALLRGGLSVDVVISDMTMPGDTSGADVATVAREAGIPVILISGYVAGATSGSPPGGRSTQIPPGTPLLSKPVSRRALLDALNGVL
jgi:signal transduction histidine kinase/CheY-like chemotaxis protein